MQKVAMERRHGVLEVASYIFLGQTTIIHTECKRFTLCGVSYFLNSEDVTTAHVNPHEVMERSHSSTISTDR